MTKITDLTGQKFGRLTVTGIAPRDRDVNGKMKPVMWECLCECGKSHVALAANMRSGDVSSCGCYKTEVQTTHGMSKDPLYATWVSVKFRVLNPNSKDFARYGAVGRDMEPEWINDFPAFREWVMENLGNKPTQEHTLDRSNNDLGYLKGNLRWATQIEQANNCRTNRVITFQGITATMKQHCARLGLAYSAVKMRLGSMGWSVEQALGIPTTGDRHYRRPAAETCCEE